jgi:phosphopantetheine adenylyltransferase
MNVYRIQWRWVAVTSAKAGEERDSIVVASETVAAITAWTRHKEGDGLDRIEIIGVQRGRVIDLIAGE